MAEPIRVLQVFARMDRGGAETMIMNVYRHIDRSKVQFDFMVHTEEHCAYDDEIEKLGGHIYHIPRYTGKNHFQYKKKWKIFLNEHPEYHIIHGHMRSTAAIYLKIANRFGLTTIAHSHSTSSGKGISAVIKNMMQLPIRYEADYLFACSQKAGEWLFGKETTKKEKFYIINNGIDVEKYKFNPIIRQSMRNKFGIEDNQFLLGHVGSFSYPKNHEFLIDIFNEVHKKKPTSVLLLIGDGELRHSIEQKVENFGLENAVIFAGVRDDIPDLMQMMDVFVFPSHYEGLPVTLIEAQAAGLKCCISDVITKEIMITKMMKVIPLKENSILWADSILAYDIPFYRSIEKKKIIDAGYDVKSVVDWLSEFYIERQTSNTNWKILK